MSTYRTFSVDGKYINFEALCAFLGRGPEQLYAWLDTNTEPLPPDIPRELLLRTYALATDPDETSAAVKAIARYFTTEDEREALVKVPGTPTT